MQQDISSHASNKVTATLKTRPGMAVTDELPDISNIQHDALIMNTIDKKRPERRKERLASLQLKLLEQLEYVWRNDKSSPCQENWPSTRQLAETCDLGIYQTRHLLLKLADERYIQLAPKRVKNTLRWYLSDYYQTILLNKDNEITTE